MCHYRVMPTVKQTAFRLTEEDLALLEAARERAGVLSRTEALRYVLRVWARTEGVELKRGRKPRKR